MKVGFVGLGKLGLPVATAMASRGLEVYGYDLHPPNIENALTYEDGFEEIHERGKDRLTICEAVGDVVANADVVFCAVQTPHGAEYEGITPIPSTRADFDYTHLADAVRTVDSAARSQGRSITLAVISTVLPGTMAREVEPLLSEYVSLVYTPSFIAMGTVIQDFLDPEFVLLGGDDEEQVLEVYVEVLGSFDVKQTSIPNAELIKVAYNTFIGLKLAFANTLGEVCHKIEGCDVDEVTDALKLAYRRLISPAYLSAGMGDGGGCHPRDNIALSWLARELDLSYDLFEATMLQRERHAEWLADLMAEKADERGLPMCLLGYAYKPGSHLVTGSPALLVRELLANQGYECGLSDPHITSPSLTGPQVFLVGCKHPEFPVDLPEGSVVIDPWRFWPDQEGVEVVRLGEAAGGRHRLRAPKRTGELLR